MQWAKSWWDQISESEKKAEQQAMKCDWKKQWMMNSSIWKLINMRLLSYNMFKLYWNLHKAENSIIIQIHMNHIDLVIFLNKTNVSDYKSFTC